LNLCVCWDFPTQTRFSETQDAVDSTMSSIPTPAAKPTELASVVVPPEDPLLVLAFLQHVALSSSLHLPLHSPLLATIKSFLHSLASLLPQYFVE